MSCDDRIVAYCVSLCRSNQSSGTRFTHVFFVLLVVEIILVLIEIVSAIVVLVVIIVSEFNTGLDFALHAPLGELLHHLEELLAIVLEQIVGYREDSSWFGTKVVRRPSSTLRGTCRAVVGEGDGQEGDKAGEPS